MKKEIFALFISLILFSITFSGCLEDSSKDNEPKMVYVNANGGAEFSKIQDAINQVGEGSSIFVYNGIYHESLEIDKSISLIGESIENTIIHYNKTKGTNDPDSVIIINADNCKINGFKITSVNYSIGRSMTKISIDSSNNIISNNIFMYAEYGIFLKRFSSNNIISSNNFLDVRTGIFSEESDHNVISKNNITSCEIHGIYCVGPINNTISGNFVSDNNYGIRISGERSNDNKIYENTIMSNTKGVYCCCKASNNIIYNNNFKQNSEYSAQDASSNQWDNGINGNYWDDYVVKYPDANQIDGIWDTPYHINVSKKDRFPLVNPVEI
jgi:parallel beta-helix repeat protein